MGNMAGIDPYELFTIQECDDAIAFVEQEVLDIESQLDNAPDDATIGWARRAKASLQIGRGLKQRLQNRRADINKEAKQEYLRQRERDENQIFINICKETLPKEQFVEIWKKVRSISREYSENKS